MTKVLSKLLPLLIMVMSFKSTEEIYSKASYYSSEHHGKRTASGERFNMYALTAAHRFYKMGTLVRVTNLNNEKTVVVRINDRGPFVASRGLDLSYQAFKDLGQLHKGVIPIKYSIIN